MITIQKELRNFLIITGVILVGVIISYSNYETIKRLNKEKSILEMNYNTVLNENTIFIGKNGELITKVDGLIVDKKELSKINEDLSRKLKSAGVKYNDVAGVADVLAKENSKLKLLLKDSVRVTIKKDTIKIDTLKCFDYKSEYDSISGCIENDTVYIDKSIKVPLTIVMENVYKHKFLWWKWGVINKKLVVTSDNPGITFPEIHLYIPK